MKKTLKFAQFLILLFLVIQFYSCEMKTKQANLPEVLVADFGIMPNGDAVKEYTMVNANGLEVSLISYGGVITSLKVPDRNGKLEDIVLGFNDLQSYIEGSPYFGALIGRFGNRIAKGKFTLAGTEYTLAQNNLGNHLHGGLQGFDKVLWNVKQKQIENGIALELSYLSKHMEEGYPGNLQVKVICSLTNKNELTFDYEATTDQSTVINLTQHSYYNLNPGTENILNHTLEINADRFLPVDSTLIPTGELKEVAGTPFDFTQAKKIGNDIAVENQQLEYGGGFDHCWIINESAQTMKFAGRLSESNSGRVMEVYTTEPAMQFYSGNFLDGSLTGKNGEIYEYRSGLCLETQHYPDSPNQPDFPSVVLNPGETYESTTSYVFSTL